jgi:hypothetical protein
VAALPAADGIDGVDRRVAVERVSSGGEQRGVETVGVGDLVNRPSRGQAPQRRPESHLAFLLATNTLRLTVTGTVPAKAIYPALRARKAAGADPALIAALRARTAAGADPALIANALACAADVYRFPTNLDSDPNVGGLTPQSQIELLQQALAEDWDTDRVTAELHAYAARHRSHD